MSDGGKGSGRRPSAVSDEVVADNWSNIFYSRKLTLEDWNILEVDGDFDGTGKTLHFVGYDTKDYTVRVSSPIYEFDPRTGLGVTRSGNDYQVVGTPSTKALQSTRVQYWLTRNGSPPYQAQHVDI